MNEEIDEEEKRELVEKFRLEYKVQQQKKKTLGKLMIGAGITVLVIGLFLSINGFMNFIDFSGGSSGFGAWIGGIGMTMAGFLLLFFGICIFTSAKRSGLIPYVKKRMREEELKDTDTLLDAVDDDTSTSMRVPFVGNVKIPNYPQNEKVVIKEVVKVRCDYCGALVNVTESICPECGGTM
ncbi:MAG: hypothetical protein ACTSUE_20125 [Promethearchaeota archaeon]